MFLTRRQDQFPANQRRKKLLKTPSKTEIETDQFLLIIGEESRFLIKQHCKEENGFYGCRAVVSFVLIETTERITNKWQEPLVTQQRAERCIHEWQFDNENSTTRYEYLFSVFLAVDEYSPSILVKFLSERVKYEWYLRFKIYSKSDIILQRDFLVVIR